MFKIYLLLLSCVVSTWVSIWLGLFAVLYVVLCSVKMSAETRLLNKRERNIFWINILRFRVFYFYIPLLRYNLYTIKFNSLNCTIQWILRNIYNNVTMPQSYTEHPHHSWLLAATELSVPRVLPFLEFSVNGIMYVAFCDWLISLLKFIHIF